MTVDVSERPYTSDVIVAMCRLNEIAVPGDYRSSLHAMLTEMAWDVAKMTNHTDVTGNAVTYRAGRYGVRIRVDQFVEGVRKVERKITWGTIIYGDKA